MRWRTLSLALMLPSLLQLSCGGSCPATRTVYVPAPRAPCLPKAPVLEVVPPEAVIATEDGQAVLTPEAAAAWAVNTERIELWVQKAQARCGVAEDDTLPP